MRQRAHADHVDTRLSELGNSLERDPPRDFDQRATRDFFQSATHLSWDEVVEHDDVGARSQCFFDGLERVYLDFDAVRMGGALARAHDSLSQAANCRDVVVLDQNAGSERVTMVERTTRAHRMTLEDPETRGRLARI